MRYMEKGNDSKTFYTWREISNLYQQLTTGQIVPSDEKLREMVERWKGGGNWFGCNSDEMNERIHNGYEYETSIDPETLPNIAYERPRYRYTDDPEGEYDHDLFQNGETEYFLTKPKRTSVGGLRLMVNYNFNSLVGDKTIADYAQWVGTVVQSLQARGYDLEIDVFFKANGTYEGHATDEHIMRLSNFGERVMPYDWSALFSPGGFRHFTFLMILWAGEVESGVQNTHGMGQAQDPNWDIKWEPKERVIEITCNANSNQFPAETMTKRFESWKE